MDKEIYAPRKLEDVVKQIKDLIPLYHIDFHNRLTSVQTSLLYCPPEQIYLWWKEVMDILQTQLPPPLMEEWQFEVISIFMIKPVELIKEQFGKKE